MTSLNNNNQTQMAALPVRITNEAAVTVVALVASVRIISLVSTTAASDTTLRVKEQFLSIILAVICINQNNDTNIKIY